MIDHISIAVRDLLKGERFYSAVLAPLGLSKLREWPNAAIGFGKKYPEFWINKREAMGCVAEDSGVHICLRAPDVASVDATRRVAPIGEGVGELHELLLEAGHHRVGLVVEDGDVDGVGPNAPYRG